MLTEKLTDSELNQVEPLIGTLKQYQKPLTAEEICHLLPAIQSGIRVRKIINYIRSNSIAPVVANSYGYWYAHSSEEIDAQVNSLSERMNSIKSARDGLLTMKNKFFPQLEYKDTLF